MAVIFHGEGSPVVPTVSNSRVLDTVVFLQRRSFRSSVSHSPVS
jgi:hypothetical protein